MDYEGLGGKYDRTIRAKPDTLVNPSSSSTTAFFGEVQVGSMQVVVPCLQVASNSMIMLSLVSYVNSVGGLAPPLCVATRAAGVGFTLGSVVSYNWASGSYGAFWEVRNPWPAPSGV